MKRRKWRDIRSAVTMMCVMAAMLSTATFAWFSLTSNPVVNGLQMTAASSEGLKISKDNTTWRNAIDMSVESDNTPAVEAATLYPATLLTKELGGDYIPDFLSPVYTGFTVTGTEAVTNVNFADYVASCTYYLKSEGTEVVNVGIMTVDPNTVDPANIGVTDGNPNVEGSFVKVITDGDSDTTDHSAIEAVRIALVVDETEVYIYEPNSGTTLIASSTYATNGLTTDPVTADVVSSFDDGVITSAGKTSDYVSQGLFTLQPGVSRQIDMYMWFEGQDDQCVDQIMKDLVEAQIQFTAVG
ncbi:MAG: hypothetical protein E7291_07620 [Lachnospiraceae bacterium]|nr:hypothetical protein [Lachnospiraceae bacterium]